jgi:hypothetical protein
MRSMYTTAECARKRFLTTPRSRFNPRKAEHSAADIAVQAERLQNARDGAYYAFASQPSRQLETRMR